MATFLSAARFYRRALLSIENDPEGAYLNLITAGEIISNFHEPSEEEALDEEARAALARIANEMEDGERLATFLRGRLRGIKRRFVGAITSMVDDSFFERWEAEDQWGSFKRDGFPGRIAAAYDLRSRFVHSGYPFGQWINLHMSQDEVQLGEPVVADRRWPRS